ncbi:MAG: VOC family protein [Sphingomonadaceae bacterium]|nr:VOC family protein [Sphingomonadaceae bacterium]
MDGVRFKRSALIVADLERSLAVYRDAIGFTLQSIKPSAADSYSYEIFDIPPTARLRMAALDGPADQPRTLALIEVQPPLPPGPGARAATVIFVADLDGVVGRLNDVPGVRILPERELHTHDGAVGREIGAIDPDGHAIVMYTL